jgi:hypothetical protein
MELEGSTFLSTLAQVAISFIGFCAIVIAIRQTTGAPLTSLQILITRTLIEHGFFVVAFSLLPLLLHLAAIERLNVWAVPSALAGIICIYWNLRYPFKYKKVRPTPMPKHIWFNIVVSVIGGVVLLLNAGGYWGLPKMAPYVIVLAWIAFQGADIFMFSLHAFIRQEKPK